MGCIAVETFLGFSLPGTVVNQITRIVAKGLGRSTHYRLHGTDGRMYRQPPAIYDGDGQADLAIIRFRLWICMVVEMAL